MAARLAVAIENSFGLKPVLVEGADREKADRESGERGEGPIEDHV